MASLGNIYVAFNERIVLSKRARLTIAPVNFFRIKILFVSETIKDICLQSSKIESSGDFSV